MSNYTPIVAYGPKDSLSHGDPNKAIKGVQIDAELAALAVAIATKIDSSFNSPTVLTITLTNGANPGNGFNLATTNTVGGYSNGVEKLAITPNGVTVADDNNTLLAAGYRGLPFVAITTNYTTVLNDRGKIITNNNSSTPVTVTLGNAAVGYGNGDLIVVTQADTVSASLTLAASVGETLTWNGNHGSRTLGDAGVAWCLRSGLTWRVIAATNIA